MNEQQMDISLETFPSLKLGYEYVIPSYEWAVERLDAAEGRLQAFQAFLATMTLGVPVLARNFENPPPLDAASLKVAFVVFGLALAVSVAGQLTGRLALVDPMRLNDEYIGLDEPEFLQAMIYYAGEDAKNNHQVVKEKNWFLIGATALGAVEIGLLISWLVLG